MITSCASNVQPPEPAPVPHISLASVGDSVVYVERMEALTFIERPSDTLAVTSNQTAVIHVLRTAPDTIEAFYEHLLLRFETPRELRDVDTQPLIGPRFVLHESDGRIVTVRAPELPSGIRQLADLRRQFDDFFLRLPAQPLVAGNEWVDTLHRVADEGEIVAERQLISRYRVRGDTVVDGISARVIDYQATITSSVRSAPTTQGTLVSRLSGEEEGSFVYAPERALMLRRSRIGLLEGELVVEGNLETLRFPQSYSYGGTTELLPPVAAGESRAAGAQRTPQP